MEPKAGIKSTEFWLSLSAVIVGAFMASGIFPADHIAVKVAGIVATVLASLGYTWSRTQAKKGPK
jgi:hypothetical protein